MTAKLPSLTQSLIRGIEQTKTRMEVAGDIDASYIKLEKSGSWVFGAEDTEVSNDSFWAVNPNSLSTGYAAWGDGECFGEEMAAITDTPVVKTDLPDHGVPWKEQVGMQLVCIEGEHKGVRVIYKATSLGGRKVFKKLLDALLARAQKGEADLVPIVVLEVDSYKHKKYGKVYIPVLYVDGWEPMDGTIPEPEPEPEKDPEPEPEPEKPAARKPRAKKRAAEPEEEEEEAPKEEAPKEEAPKRRRRRA